MLQSIDVIIQFSPPKPSRAIQPRRRKKKRICHANEADVELRNCSNRDLYTGEEQSRGSRLRPLQLYFLAHVRDLDWCLGKKNSREKSGYPVTIAAKSHRFCIASLFSLQTLYYIVSGYCCGETSTSRCRSSFSWTRGSLTFALFSFFGREDFCADATGGLLRRS